MQRLQRMQWLLVLGRSAALLRKALLLWEAAQLPASRAPPVSIPLYTLCLLLSHQYSPMRQAQSSLSKLLKRWSYIRFRY